MSIGTTIKRLRKEKNITQEQLAEYLGITSRAISLGEKILEECTSDRERHNAICSLCSLYARKGDIEKAIALSEKMPSLFSSTENLLSDIYTGSKLTEHLQCKLSSLFCLIYNDLWHITEPSEDDTCPYTNQEYIQILEKFPAIMDIVIEDKNYGLFAIQLVGTKLKLAQYYILEQMPEKALECLQAATEYAVRYDTGLHAGGNYTCLLFRNIGFGPALININENQCLLLLHRLEESAFDQVREHPDFQKIVSELQKYGAEL